MEYGSRYFIAVLWHLHILHVASPAYTCICWYSASDDAWKVKTFTLLGPRLVKFGEDSIGQRGPSHTILEVFESTYSVLSNFFLLMVPLTPSLWLWLGYTFPRTMTPWVMDPPPAQFSV